MAKQKQQDSGTPGDVTPEETGAKVARSSGWADKYSDKADC